MTQHRIEYFDEGSSIPDLLFIFNFLSMAIKSCTKCNRDETQLENDQTNSRRGYVKLMLKLINRINDQNKNYDEEWATKSFKRKRLASK